MEKRNKEIRTLLKAYGHNRKQLIQEHPELENLYALSVHREALLEWYEFRPEGKLLQIGADYGALTGLFADKLSRVTVLDPDEEAALLVQERYPQAGNITCETAGLAEFVMRQQADGWAESGGAGYDYVAAVGSIEKPYRQFLEQAKSLLKPDGILILAVGNPFGMKYWAGARREENSISLMQLQELLGEAGDTRFYYPNPDYKIPVSIYSDQYLPKKGDLTDPLPAYGYPDFELLDVGASFDFVCEQGQFPQYANSYLIFWSMDRSRLYPEQDRLFMKYNLTRREDFQIRTAICCSGADRYVEKTALTLACTGHIWSFTDKYQALIRQYSNQKVVKPDISKDGRTAVFPYLYGETWAEKLGHLMKENGEWKTVIRRAMAELYEGEAISAAIRPFIPDESFYEVFGSPEQWGDECHEGWERILTQGCCQVSNIDGLFENMLITGDGTYCLDYEWVFDFPVPLSFLKYRTLFYLHRQYQSVMRNVSLESFLEEFGISGEEIVIYQQMERCFQKYVHGENQNIFLGNFMVPVKTAADLIQSDRDLHQALERVEQYKVLNQEKDSAIRKMTEVQRLTNNHVTNLEVMISDLRREIDEMGKTLTYLNNHEALASKVRRKLSAGFNQKYPKGSPERKKLTYKKEYLLHPIRSLQFYSTAEGKNLRDGDFAIGDSYRQHGKLKFEPAAAPLVSIIIPVYNQIHYTYDCLVSILEHTRDVTYEVIIADDVSTDATAHLGNYAEGLVICRNTANQGFLRNCNNAARHAGGRYLMFLNNDTQVTAGWLSSLVKLIESDHSIGMVGSKLVYPDGRLQEAGGIIWSDGSGWNYGRLDNPDKPEYNYVKDVDYISGAAILLSNQLWKDIGGFDTRFAPAYCEDSDLAFEVRRRGKRVVYQPLSKVIHFEGISNGTDVEGSGLKRYQIVNNKKLREKWAEALKLQGENNGNPDPFRARERSMGKPMILVVDHYVPTYDKDAGSKTTFQYLKMFLRKGYVVKFLGDNFRRDEPYSTTLQQMGVEILYGADYQTGIWDWLKDHGDDIAVAYLNRPHIAGKYVDYILDNTNIKVIYYGHDLHFMRESREYALTGDAKRRQSAEYWKAIELSLMNKAAVSYYPSVIEQQAIWQIDRSIPVKAITAYVYEEFKEQLNEDFAVREGLLFVGGFAHPPNEDAVLWFADEIWPQIRSVLPIPFYIVGSKVTGEIQALESRNNGIVVKGFVSDEELEALYQQCRIVVVPLRYGAGVKGKVVEAIYNGAPIVTTFIGAEGIPQAEEVLVIADEPEDFAAAVLQLYQDEAVCLELCRRTQRYIREYFSIDAAWAVIEEDFRG